MIGIALFEWTISFYIWNDLFLLEFWLKMIEFSVRSDKGYEWVKIVNFNRKCDIFFLMKKSHL